MAKYANKTEVSQEKSRMEIEQTLRRYGADAFSYGWQESSAMIAFRACDRHVRFTISMPVKGDEEFTHYKRGSSVHERTAEAAEREWEQACRQRWRALALVVKAKLEAVDTGISEFESEFLANIVLPNGDTVAEQIKPYIQQAYIEGRMLDRPLLLSAGAAN